MSTAKKLTTAALAGAVATAMASFAVPAAAEDADQVKCYGVAKAGENDCASTGNNSCAGTSTVDYDGGAWKLVPAGTCTDMETPLGPGSLEPIDRGA